MSESYPAHLGPDRAMRRRDARAFWRAFGWALAAVALLGWIKALETMFGESLDGLGIVPRTTAGLIGVLTAPLVHGSFEHLLTNAFALIVLVTLARYAYPRALNRALPLIWILSGVGCWLIGRPSVHIGASGVTEGLLFFIFGLGVLRRERRSIGIALATWPLYGGLLVGLVPHEAGVSWEYHLAGAIAGTIAALLWRKLDPAAPRPKYSWDYEEEAAAAEAAALRARGAELEPPSPDDVAPLWDGPSREPRGVVLAFPARRDADEKPPTVH
ncbi:MAG TPA: rhomboid family intramembrane serine protease [Xanthomonadales bacterium]|nr:rhomboid family intramembrane serine protease [Xanthomonadales bacterium]